MNIAYKPELPRTRQPIVIIGAGGIVRDAHLPAYRQAGFEVFGITNRTRGRAEKLALDFDIPHVFPDVREAVARAPKHAVFDLTLMPSQFVEVLEQLPDAAPVLIQKPMGDNLQQAREILEACRRKRLKAAVNCQLRFAPFVMAARDLLRQGVLGECYDLEVRVTVKTPWELFPNVMHHPRLEIQQHSVHYVDLIRSFLGNPKGIWSKTCGHPEKPFSSTRSTIVFDYGDKIRAVINVNHDHDFGARHQDSFIKWEGTRGAALAQFGLLKNYPQGDVDCFEYCLQQDTGTPAWQKAELEGSWFPEAFAGAMASLMRFTEGSAADLPASVEDVFQTMACVEAAYETSAQGAPRVFPEKA